MCTLPAVHRAAARTGSRDPFYKLVESRFRRHLDLIGDAIGPSLPGAVISHSRRKAWHLPSTTAAEAALTEQPRSRGGRLAGAFFITPNFIDEPGFMSAADLRRLHDGAPVVTGSVPGGFYSVEVAQMAAAAGIQVLFNSEPTRRVSLLGDLSVVGRFSITRRTSDVALASLASGRRGAALTQQLAWSGKKVLKQLGGEAWLKLRRTLFDLGAG
jgi:hypothetical protein